MSTFIFYFLLSTFPSFARTIPLSPQSPPPSSFPHTQMTEEP